MSNQWSAASHRLTKSSLDQTEISLDSPECADIVSYPKLEAPVLKERLVELRSLGVMYLIATGKTMIGTTTIAGKGCVGLVVKVRLTSHNDQCEELCALKIRRADANRPSLEEEARLHRIANSAGIGPLIRKSSANFLLMDFIYGPTIIDWALQTADVSLDVLRTVASSILRQCYLLDNAGVDHGQLSKLDRHVIISAENIPIIIDFESASTNRKTANVTAAAQALFIGGGLVAKKFGRLCTQGERSDVVAALKTYKEARTQASFEKVLHALNLADYSF